MIFPNRQDQRQTHPFQNQPFAPFQHQQVPNQRQGVGQLLKGLSTNKQSLTTMANKGVNGLSKTLGHVQQVMQVVQSAAPVVQEYGPMVKNLPAMYRMMKAMKQADETNDGSPQPQAQVQPEQQTAEQSIQKAETTEGDYLPGTSQPKLFI